MKDPAQLAPELARQFKDLICAGFTPVQTDKAMAEITRWLNAWIEDYKSHGADDQQQLIESYIPTEIKDTFSGRSPEERFDLAATAFDRWRLQALNTRTYNRAVALMESEGGSQQAKTEAEADLRELQAIEARLMKDFPDIYKMHQTTISESKLDAIYVLRGEGLVSRRLGRQLQRRKRKGVQEQG